MIKSKNIISILLILIFTFFSFVLVSCDNTSPESQSGKMIPYYNDSNEQEGFVRRGYSTEVLLQREDFFDLDKNLTYFKAYEYDSDNNLIQETWYKSNGIGDYYYTYKYDDAGNIVEKGYYPAEGNVNITIFDSQGNEIEKYYYDNNDELYLHQKLENDKWIDYDKDDNIIE